MRKTAYSSVEGVICNWARANQGPVKRAALRHAKRAPALSASISSNPKLELKR